MRKNKQIISYKFKKNVNLIFIPVDNLLAYKFENMI